MTSCCLLGGFIWHKLLAWARWTRARGKMLIGWDLDIWRLDPEKVQHQAPKPGYVYRQGHKTVHLGQDWEGNINYAVW